MRVSLIALFALSLALAQLRSVEIQRPVAVTVTIASEGTVSFRLSQQVVTDIDPHLRGVEYSIPLQCAGGLHDVNFATVELVPSGGEQDKADGSFALLFEMGNEQSRRFGQLPRVQLSFYRRRLTEMLVTNMTSERAAFSSKLCPTLPVGPVTCKDTRRLQGLPPDVLVQQLRDLPAPMPAAAVASEAERKRRSIYEELLDWGARSIKSLESGLRDPDVRLRRNVALGFIVLGGGWWPFECGPATLDIRPALPALTAALEDSDPQVRGWAAQVVAGMGANAADAVPALTKLLRDDDEGSRNSACIALGQIGPPAIAALPALRVALSDKSEAVRRFAERAIQRIER